LREGGRERVARGSKDALSGGAYRALGSGGGGVVRAVGVEWKTDA
jgi:hypothetical protein